jgi:hypothetical protein
MFCYKDRTFCASKECNEYDTCDIGAKEINAMPEDLKSWMPVAYSEFYNKEDGMCGYYKRKA